ncbi:hypothetical protein pb186bvf_010851 [Paramecium bursaria]
MVGMELMIHIFLINQKHFMKASLSLILLLVVTANSMFCNYYPLDPYACISKTDGIACQFDNNQNACLPVQLTNLGCQPNLNRMACQLQLTNSVGQEARCYFGNRCKQVNQPFLNKIGCDSKLSRYACANVQGFNCVWKDVCKVLDFDPNYGAFECHDVFKTSVVPQLCATIPALRCYNAGLYGNYECSAIPQQFIIRCNSLGVNRETCLSLTGQKCQYINNRCQNYVEGPDDKCNLQLNRDACLSIINPNTTCQWNNAQCSVISVNKQTCDQFTNINRSVCAKTIFSCGYNSMTNTCFDTSIIQAKTCDDPGLSLTACFLLQQNCSYYLGHCATLSQTELNTYKCDMQLNKMSCLNIITAFQNCQWDPLTNTCSYIFVKTDTPCQQANMLVNGNYCNAIVSEGCKYDTVNKICINSTSLDTCSDSFINLNGCVQIQRAGQICKFINNVCQNIVVTQFQTKCTDLVFVNSAACAAVYTTNPDPTDITFKDGCYWDSTFYKCKDFNESDPNINQVLCLTPGLNAIGCSIVTQPGQFCRWFSNKCTQLFSRTDISDIPCINLVNVNAATCGLSTFGQQFCNYKRAVLGCISSYDINAGLCNDKGVNQYACGAIRSYPCLYDQVNQVCKLIQDIDNPGTDTKALLATAYCLSNAPTQKVCLAISQPGQNCAWSKQFGSCVVQTVQKNQPCLKFTNVNQSVCTAILMDVPEGIVGSKYINEINQGYCQYDPGKYSCQKYTKVGFCAKPCCSDLVGINAHVCSRYTNPAQFCYFQNGTCKQFTGSQSDFQKFINDQQLPCSFVQAGQCVNVLWSTTQQCYQTWSYISSIRQNFACVNINYDSYDNLDFYFTQTPTSNQMNQYACQGIIGYMFGTIDQRYYKWDPAANLCNNFKDGNIPANTCDAPYLKYKYCFWNVDTFTCQEITDQKYYKDCSNILNQSACLKVNQPSFANQAEIIMLVVHTLMEIPQSLQKLVNKLQQIQHLAQLIQPTNLCKTYNTVVDKCDVGLANAIACYAYTQSDCRWDPINFKCYQQSDIQNQIQILKCTDYVNKNLCLKIQQQPCFWDKTALRCKNFVAITSCPDKDGNNYNSLACLSVQGSGCAFDSQKNVCLPQSSISGCNIYSLNRYSCLMNSSDINCQYDETLPQQIRCYPYFKQITRCETANINIKLCRDAKLTCYFDINDQNCKTQIINSSTTCSSLASFTNRYYNKFSCFSISPNQSGKNGANSFCSTDGDTSSLSICGFDKYCQWTGQTCATIPLGSGALTQHQDCPGGDSSNCTTKLVCSKDQIQYKECNPNFSMAACLNLTQNKCVFDINSGGCQDSSSSPNVSQNLLSCEYANKSACSDLNGANYVCQSNNENNPIDDTCAINISNANYNQKSCALDTDGTQTCTQLNSKNGGCSQAADNCYFDGSNCSDPGTLLEGTTLTCTGIGLSESACIFLKYCAFVNGLCQYLSGPSIKNTCDSANITADPITLLKTCGSVIPATSTSPSVYCMYNPSGTSKCIDVASPSSSTLKDQVTNLAACIAVTDDAMAWNSSTFVCSQIASILSSCQNLNMMACLINTQGNICQWVKNACTETTMATLQQQTDCTIQGAYSCLLVNIPCMIDSNGYCKQVKADSNLQCADIKKGNQNSCQFAIDSCMWNSVGQKCDTVGSIQNCNQFGLSKTACTSKTFSDSLQNACIFSSTGCRYIDESQNSKDLTDLPNIPLMNKYGCIMLNVPAGWDNSSNTCKPELTPSASQTCTSFITEPYYNFSKRACAGIEAPSKSCYQNDLGRCDDLAKEVPCTTPGINKYGCLNMTSGTCYFDTVNFLCKTLIINQSLVTCDANYNKYSCASVNNQCYYTTGLCQNFVLSTTDLSQAMIQTSLANTFYTPLVCSNIKIVGATILYNQSTYNCQLTSLKTASCTDLGLSIQACLQNTNQYCVYIEGQGCQNISGIVLQQQKQCGLKQVGSTKQYLNWYACISIPITPACIFDTTVIDGCKQQTSTNCSTYTSQYLVPAEVCSATIDLPCQFNQDTYSCQIIQQTDVKNCTDQGLNNLACQLNTTGTTTNCIFNSSTKSCYQGSSNDQTYYSCSSQYLLNYNNCLANNNTNQYCIIINNICQSLAKTDTLATTCLKTNKSNAQACSLATDAACMYDSTNKTCKKGSPTTCGTDFSINQIGCIQTDLPSSQCKWFNSQCLAVQTAELSVLTCTDIVNKSTCVAITTLNQYCQFKANQCTSLSITPTAPYICTDLVNINNGLLCAQVASDVACRFNSPTFSCMLVTTTLTSCDQSLSKLACETKTNVSPSCIFKNLCYQSSQFKNCSDATTQADCLSKFDKISCQFLNNKCVPFITTDIACSSQPQLVNSYTCSQLKVSTIIDQCVSQNDSCIVSTAFQCEALTQQSNCLYLPGVPCLWNTAEVKPCYYLPVENNQNICQLINGNGSQRACLDVNKQGQMCQFVNYQCLSFQKFTTGCTQDVNYNACVAQQDFSCYWEKQSVVIKSNGLNVTYIQGNCKTYTLKPTDPCNENLSYSACLQIQMARQFCQWTVNYCTLINTNQLPSIIPLNYFSQINANACALITTEAAIYDPKTKICISSDSISQCNTPGINKITCVSAQNISCQWDPLQYTCSSLATRRLLTTITNCQQLQNVSAQVCQKISSLIACQFSNDSCIKMLQNATCTDPGINQFGCLSITTNPCIWLNGQCQDYYPTEACLEAPSNINSVVCSSIDSEGCKYDKNMNKCILSGGEQNCNVLGINYIGCSQIPYCVFKDNICSLENGNLACADAQFANQLVCKNSFERCKYSNLSYGCIKTSLTELCSSAGISQLSCYALNQCNWQDNQCRCIPFLKQFPDCNTIKTYAQCKQVDYCYFEIEKVESQKDLTTYLQNQNYGKCRNKLCSDTDCSTNVNGNLCYFDDNLKCQSASRCSDIQNPSKVNYSGCQQFIFNNQPCQNANNQCQQLNCSQLNFGECQTYSKYCYFTKSCFQRTCAEYDQVMCQININQCDWDGLTCSNQQPCSSIQTFSKCNLKQQGPNRCGWVLNNNSEICVNNPCRYMGVTQSQCSGTHIVNQVCVQLSDQSCVSCEEISDQCTCLDQGDMCSYDKIQSICYSKPCSSFSQSTCPNRCRYYPKINECVPICSNIYNSNDCMNAPLCNWDFVTKLCFDYNPKVVPPRIILPKAIHQIQMIYGIILILIV